jgi:hypothetical protein
VTNHFFDNVEAGRSSTRKLLSAPKNSIRQTLEVYAEQQEDVEDAAMRVSEAKIKLLHSKSLVKDLEIELEEKREMYWCGDKFVVSRANVYREAKAAAAVGRKTRQEREDEEERARLIELESEEEEEEAFLLLRREKRATEKLRTTTVVRGFKSGRGSESGRSSIHGAIRSGYQHQARKNDSMNRVKRTVQTIERSRRAMVNVRRVSVLPPIILTLEPSFIPLTHQQTKKYFKKC